MPSKQEAIDFIKSKNGLEGWTDNQILQALNLAIKQCAFTYTIDGSGKLTGIFIGKWTKPTETLYATYFAGKYRHFLKYLKNIFPKCKTIEATRLGKYKVYHI